MPLDAAVIPRKRKIIQCALAASLPYVPYNWEEDSATEYNMPIENHDGFYGDGYDVQIAKRVAEAMGKEPVFVKVSFDGLMQALNNGQIDMVISGMLDSPEHRQAADFFQYIRCYQNRVHGSGE